MCHYITAFLPSDANLHASEVIFDQHKLGFRRISNPFVQAQVQAGDIYILTTRKHCDCGTPLGSLVVSNTGKTVDATEQAAKLRKQGWSAAKVERWLQQKEQTAQSKAQEKEQQGTPQVASWQDFLSDLLHSGCTPRVGLLLHWYKGRVDTERIDVTGWERVALPNLTKDRLLHMREDVIYTFVRGG